MGRTLSCPRNRCGFGSYIYISTRRCPCLPAEHPLHPRAGIVSKNAGLLLSVRSSRMFCSTSVSTVTMTLRERVVLFVSIRISFAIILMHCNWSVTDKRNEFEKKLSTLRKWEKKDMCALVTDSLQKSSRCRNQNYELKRSHFTNVWLTLRRDWLLSRRSSRSWRRTTTRYTDECYECFISNRTFFLSETCATQS